jgi:hypothetical protein
MPRRTRPRVVVLSGEPLFASFFDHSRRRRLSRSFDWTRSAARAGTPVLRARLAEADGLVTTWDSPIFDAALPALAPRLRIVAHCGGEVKARFSRDLFSRLTIANAPGPMAPYVAELALTFLLMAARRVDHYRQALRRPSNAAYQEAHVHGCGRDTLRDRTVGVVLRIGVSVTAGALLGGLLLYVSPNHRPTWTEIFGFVAIGLFSLTIVRLVAHGLIDEDILKRRILVYGSGNNAARILALRRRNDQRGFKVVGFIASASEDHVIPEDKLLSRDVPMVTTAADLRRRVRRGVGREGAAAEFTGQSVHHRPRSRRVAHVHVREAS